MVGKQALEIVDRIFFRLNGVVYVDRKDKASKKKGFKKMLKLLNAGRSLLIYPEGTWNMTPSKPMLPMNWGVIELARSTGIPIVPLVAEYHSDCCYVKFGEAIYIGKELNKKEGIDQLENIMATLRWDIWERFPMEIRNEKMKEAFEHMIQSRIDEYSKFNLDYERTVARERK